jgi:hypothetical protein
VAAVTSGDSVLRLGSPALRAALQALCERYGLPLAWVSGSESIPGSYWGETEAGLKDGRLQLRHDTPLHSALHEASHFLCMDPSRRTCLDTDAGGDFAEEDAVCYLQVVLAEALGIPRDAACADMDAWGYTFRLGSAGAWFGADAEDARDWLVRHGLVCPDGHLTYRARAA